MLGKPKFKEGDKVQFPVRLEDDTLVTCKGEVYIVDAYGTFEQCEEPSYDVMVDWMDSGTNVLFKHVVESVLEAVK